MTDQEKEDAIWSECTIVQIDQKRPGGQHVGTYTCGWHVVHEPTGLVIIVPPEAAHRSQHKTRNAIKFAMAFLFQELNS